MEIASDLTGWGLWLQDTPYTQIVITSCRLFYLCYKLGFPQHPPWFRYLIILLEQPIELKKHLCLLYLTNDTDEKMHRVRYGRRGVELLHSSRYTFPPGTSVYSATQELSNPVLLGFYRDVIAYTWLKNAQLCQNVIGQWECDLISTNEVREPSRTCCFSFLPLFSPLCAAVLHTMAQDTSGKRRGLDRVGLRISSQHKDRKSVYDYHFCDLPEKETLYFSWPILGRELRARNCRWKLKFIYHNFKVICLYMDIVSNSVKCILFYCRINKIILLHKNVGIGDT